MKALSDAVKKVSQMKESAPNSNVVDRFFQDKLGIVLGHGYSVLDAKADNGKKWLKLRNPWGDTPYKGGEKPGFKDKDKEADGGTFWIKWEEFLKYYSDVSIGK